MNKTENRFQLLKDTMERINAGIRYARKQDYYQFSMEEKKILEQIEEILLLCDSLGLKDVIQDMQQAFIQIMGAKEAQDYILTADYYELLLLPLLNSILEFSRQWETEEDYWQLNCQSLEKRYPNLYRKLSVLSTEEILAQDKYQLEDTMSGHKTLLVQGANKRVYFHSNNNPKEEARQLAEAVYDRCNTVYHVLGLGLGYLPEALLSMDTSSSFVVYEGDLNIIKLMCGCRDCTTLLESRRVELIYDKDYQIFLSHLQEGHIVFHEPSLHNITNKEQFIKFYDYFITIQSGINQRKRMQENFTCNLLHKDESVEVLKKEMEGKEVYLVAGGPSLDKTLESLKSRPEDAKIVCVGTSVRKLKAAGIFSDYMVVTDPMPWMAEQIEAGEDIPLWYLSTAFYEVRNRVKKGYLILQKGYAPAEEKAHKNGWHLYGTGGSVTTTALDILLSMNCTQIICMGMDMAYTESKSHADGTAMARNIGEEHNKNLIPVKGVKGDTLYAPKNLTLYRKWIENRVRKEEVLLTNVSDGAYISGMDNISTDNWNKK